MSRGRRQRPGRGRRRVRADRRPGPGRPAPPQARLPPRDAARVAPRDAASSGGRGARAARRRRRPRRCRSGRSAGSGQQQAHQLGQRRPGCARQGEGRPRARSSGPGIDLVDGRPRARRCELLTEAYQQLDKAEEAKRHAARRRPAARAKSSPASTGCTASSRWPRPTCSRSSRRRAPPAFDLRAMVAGPTARRTSSTGRPKPVYRVDLKRKRADADRRGRRRPAARRMADAAVPRGRWPRPADPRRQERPVALAAVERRRQGHDQQGHGQRRDRLGRRRPGDRHVRPRPRTAGLYNLYVVDPSEQQIRAYPPASDGGGFPAECPAWLATARDGRQDDRRCTSTATSSSTEDGVLERFTSGKTEAGTPGAPGDDAPAPDADVRSLVARRGRQATGRVYAYDQPNAPGHRLRQGARRLRRRSTGWPEGDGWKDLRGDVRHPRGRGRAGDADLAVRRRASTRRCSRPCPTRARRVPAPPARAPARSAGAVRRRRPPP